MGPDQPLKDVSTGIPGWKLEIHVSHQNYIAPKILQHHHSPKCYWGKVKSNTNFPLPIGFLLHKDIKYDTLDKKFQYYQENRDEYYELKQTLMRMVLETSVKSLYDELNSIEEYMEIIEHAENNELGK